MKDILSGLSGLSAMSPAVEELEPVIVHAPIHRLQMEKHYAQGLPAKPKNVIQMRAAER